MPSPWANIHIACALDYLLFSITHLFCSNAYFDNKDIGDALILYLSSGIHFTRTASVSV